MFRETWRVTILIDGGTFFYVVPFLCRFGADAKREIPPWRDWQRIAGQYI